MPHHVVLLGDSILDNASYTAGEPDVVSHLRSLLASPWRASLRAVDGSTAVDLVEQLLQVPSDASHLIISVGGNDALLNGDLLALPVRSTTEALQLFGARLATFETTYHAAIASALELKLPTTLCTIYNGNLHPSQAGLARLGLMMFNDVILRTAFEHHLSVIDLRLVCNDPSDYANPIEPSGSGGHKIARSIARSLGLIDEEARHSVVYAD
jgi:lysophospholipase L1-like esterase